MNNISYTDMNISDIDIILFYTWEEGYDEDWCISIHSLIFNITRYHFSLILNNVIVLDFRAVKSFIRKFIKYIIQACASQGNLKRENSFVPKDEMPDVLISHQITFNTQHLIQSHERVSWHCDIHWYLSYSIICCGNEIHRT